MARAGGLEDDLADPEAALGEGQQVDPADDEVATQLGRLHRAATDEGADGGQVLGLHQRHLAAAAEIGRRPVGTSVAEQAEAGYRPRRGRCRDRGTPGRA